MPSVSKALSLARKLIAKAKKICVLTGAGISAESGPPHYTGGPPDGSLAGGLKTFRDAGGLWEDHPVEKVATWQGFSEDPERVWRFYNARRKSADVAAPNPAHLALARLELIKSRH